MIAVFDCLVKHGRSPAIRLRSTATATTKLKADAALHIADTIKATRVS